MFSGDNVLTWRFANVTSIILMTVGAAFVLVIGRQLFKRFADGQSS